MHNEGFEEVYYWNPNWLGERYKPKKKNKQKSKITFFFFRFLELDLMSGNAAIKHGKPAQGADVVSLRLGRSQSEVVVAHKSGTVRVLRSSGAPALSVSGFAGPLAGAAALSDGTLLCLTAEGSAHVLDIPAETESTTTTTVSVEGTQAALQVERPVESFDVSGSLLAIGGKENRLRVWDLTTKQKVFEARNPPDDWLCLKVPMWISGLKFLPRTADAPARIAIVTRNRDVQVFELSPEADRRPVWKAVVGDDPLNCVAVSPDGTQLYCGSSTGFVYVLDAATGGVIGRMTPSCAGSVRDIACFGNELVLAVGLDRFVYGYSSSLRTNVHKVYAKQRLCKVLVLEGEENGEKKQQEEEDDDDAWFGLPSRVQDGNIAEEVEDEGDEVCEGAEEEIERNESEMGTKKRADKEHVFPSSSSLSSLSKSLDKLKSKTKKHRTKE